MKLFVILYGTIAALYGYAILSTGVWTLTGHCCGMYVWPISNKDQATRCLPWQDRHAPYTWFERGRCDDTWHRV